MKKILKSFVSTRTSGVLFILFALAMAIGTFVENAKGTPAAKALIYEAWWFELIMILLIFNFIGNIKRYQLYRREKWPLLVFHLSFVFIFIGGAITRYISYEGMMMIREGETSNEIISSKSFFRMQIDKGQKARAYTPTPYLMSYYNGKDRSFPLKKTFRHSYDFFGETIELKSLDYVEFAKDTLIESPTGNEYIHLVTTSKSGRSNLYLKDGEIQNVNGVAISYNNPQEGTVVLTKEEGEIHIESPIDANYMVMATQSQGKLKGYKKEVLQLRALYQIGELKFVVPKGFIKGKKTFYSADKETGLPAAITLELRTEKETDTLTFRGGKGLTNYGFHKRIGDKNFSIGFGSVKYLTPFSIQLRDFQMDRYPGSNSPSSFASEITVIPEKEAPFDKRIYMNHVLDYQGYRMFQSGFDPDEQGTRLSVNHDVIGTIITYIGYVLLFLGLIVSLLWKGTRFWKLNDRLKKINKKKALLPLLLFFPFLQNAQEIALETSPTPKKVINYLPADSIVNQVKITPEHAAKFGQLLIQDQKGRIKPINTLATEILRKVHGKSTYHGLDANQWFISVHLNPHLWGYAPLIKIGTKGGDKLAKQVDSDTAGYTTLLRVFGINEKNHQEPRYVLEDAYLTSFSKSVVNQSKYDKELLLVNERVQIMQGIIAGQYLRIFPIKNDLNDTWSSWITQDFTLNKDGEAFLKEYSKALFKATQTNDYTQVDALLIKINAFQQQWGGELLPSKEKIEWETRYNQWNIFFKSMMAYSLFGLILLILSFARLFSDNKVLQILSSVALIGIVLTFLAHFLGLVLRWYISGHAPWSDGYESIVFISWCTVGAGLIFYRNKNTFIPASAALMTVMLLGIAHGNLMSPEITNLVPVLKSYWLMIHVAIITSSYAFFGLSAFLGLLVLVLYSIENDKIKEKIETTTHELSIINEMSMTFGLIVLSIGTFLGGIWANESWGRYWSWDPKETWAFISIMIYAFVLHMRLIPGLKSRFTFNTVSIYALGSIIMTYFGVNYFLSGLHSYAAGDAVPIPTWVYFALLAITLLVVFSYIRHSNPTKK